MIQNVHHDGVVSLERNFSHDSSSSGNVSPAPSDISLQHDDQDDFMNDNVISISPGVPSFNIVTSEGSSSSSTNGNVADMSCPLDIKMGFEELCPVCGDKVSGYHYGLLTCESCKGFFKRTVQNKKVYSCVDNRNCHIDKSQRKRCPYCRFQKCLRVGMKLEAVRSDRMRGGRNKFGPMYKRDRALKQQAMRQQQQLIASCQMRLTEGMTPDQLSMMEDIKPNPALLMAAASGTLNGQFHHSANMNSPQFNMNSSRVSPSLSAVNLMNSLPDTFSLSTDFNMNGISRSSVGGGGGVGGVMRGRSSSQAHISNGVSGGGGGVSGNSIGSLLNSPNTPSQGNHHYSGQPFPSPPNNNNANSTPHPAHNPPHHPPHHHSPPSSNNNNTNSTSNGGIGGGNNGSIFQLQNHHVNNNNNINNNLNNEDLRLPSLHSNGINSSIGVGTISTSHVNLHHNNHHHSNNSSSNQQNHMRMSSGGGLLRRPLSYDSQLVPTVPPLIKDMQSSMVDDMQIQQKLSTFIEPEMEELQMTSSPDKLMHIVCQIADQCLFVLVEWARNSTFFKDIKVEDQMKLLQNCWSELILLDFIFRQVKEYWTDQYVLASGHHFSSTYLDKLGLNDVKDRLQELVKKMRDLKMDYNEYICLRFLILLNPDVGDIEGRHYVELCQEQVNASLLEYCMHFYPDMKDKFGQVLLRLPEIRLISIRLEEYLYFRHLNGEVPEQTLLMEMLHSKRK